MARSHSLLLAGLAGLALLVAGLGYFVGTDPKPSPQPSEIATPPPASDPPASSQGAAGTLELLAPNAGNSLVEVGDPQKTTVAWPLNVRLELIEAAGLPHAAGTAALGASATARLSGSITSGIGDGLAGSVKFVAGPNLGRVLKSNASGKFGASDLYPGLSVVEIGAGNESAVRREVRLRCGSETSLNLGFGMPGSASGRVLDREGKPIEGASVELDGQRLYTDPEGAFLFTTVPCGLDLVCEVSKQGYAAHFELVTVAARQTNDRLVFTLLPEAELDIEIPEAIGGSMPATAVLMNASSSAQRGFPWRTKNPVSVPAGSRVRIDGLPAGVKVRVYVFHHGAYAKPAFAEVTLQEGVPQVAVVHLEAAPLIVGTLRTRDGLVAQGAKVRLEAPDRVGSTVAYFGETALFLESEVLPNFPMGVQETVSDHNGRFEFTSYPKQAPKRYLVATSADGSLSGAALVGPNDETVDVTLQASGAGTSELRLEMPGRHQAIEVECSVRGAPRDRLLVPAHEPYVIIGLTPGLWRMTASWRGQETQATAESGGTRGFKLEGETTQVIRLPQGAIDGQDAETLLRAGRKP